MTAHEPIPRVGLYAMRAVAQEGTPLAAAVCVRLLDEVERLRAILADADGAKLDVRDHLRAEVARLRAVATGPRAEVAAFAHQMEAKLVDNDHKGHWSGCTMGYLMRRLNEETEELRRAIMSADGQASATPDEAARIVSEAADVANFAMMIADNARRAVEATKETT